MYHVDMVQQLDSSRWSIMKVLQKTDAEIIFNRSLYRKKKYTSYFLNTKYPIVFY